MPSYNSGVYRLVSGRAKTVSRVDYARHDRCQTVHFGCCVAFLSLATFRTWPFAQSLSTRIPSDAGDPILNIWLFWWTRGRDPVRRAMGEAACAHSVAGRPRAVRAGGVLGHRHVRRATGSAPARARLTTSHSSCRLRYRPVASCQFPVASLHLPGTGFERPEIGLPTLPSI